MKTQISRHTFQPDKRYSGVYQQQGRMLVDADWNELVEILKHRLDEALQDVVRDGAPLHNGIVDFSAVPPQIRWGRIYVDGIRGELRPRIEAGSPAPAVFDFTRQRDFPGVDSIAPGGDYILYADVWERPVVSIEDALLRDPGLHGADTCTRTQTMAQIKWCPTDLIPEIDAVRNPRKGNAELNLSLRLSETIEGEGESDPCGFEIVDTDQKTGNYLFRLEVHDIQGPAAGPAKIVLKWSTENGAEQHVVRENGGLVDTVPTEFKMGDWIYEVYSDTSEAHLGVHHAAGGSFPLRFELIANGYPSAIDSAARYIRRWDGYCELTQNGTWSVAGKDGAIDLKEIAASTPDESATHGDVKFEGGRMKIFLNNMVLALDLDGKAFVAGDYWLAVVRENAAEEDHIKVLSKQPIGIEHHYLKIAQYQSDEIAVYANDENRKFSFPPLTRLTADKVGYDPAAAEPRWTDIHDDATIPLPLTVQAAIDDLVEHLESSDIIYKLPGCSAPLSVRRLLPAIKTLADEAEQKINAILNAILCELNAATLPCEDRGAAMPVQDALDNRVHKDGDTMTGKLTIDAGLEVTAGHNVGVGTSSPAAQLHVEGDIDTGLSTHGLLVLGKISDINLSLDANEIMARKNGAGATLDLNREGGLVVVNRDGHGNMSIGTPTDSGDRLNVGGTLKTDGFKMPTNPQNNYVLTSDANGLGTWQPPTPLGWKQVGNDLVLDTGQISGNVGIGTTNPSQKLHVAGGAIRIDDNLGVFWGGNSVSIYGSQAGGYLRLKAASADAVTINSNGDMGIGTTSPSGKLQVHGTVLISPDTSSKLYVGRYSGSFPNTYISAASGAEQMRLQIGDSTKMSITSGGNIGINTTSPSNTLHTNGTSFAVKRAGGGIDYAEYFESLDGKKVAVGTAVAFERGKIRPAKKDEVPFGVISANSIIVGGVHHEWPKKYLRDDFGAHIMEKVKEEIMAPKKEQVKKERQKTKKRTVREEVTRTEVVFKNKKYCRIEIREEVEREVEEPLFKEVDLYDEKGKLFIGRHRIPVMETYEETIDVFDDEGNPLLVGTGEFETKERPKINPEYDETKEYVPREKRPEWNIVGLMGQIPLRKGQPAAPTWIKIKDISNKVELWLIK